MSAPPSLNRDVLLFSYGTLQDDAVQLACFGRRLSGEPDAIAGYRRTTLAIEDAAGGTGPIAYPILDASPDRGHRVEGVVLPVTADELVRADAYEGPEYRRVRVRTQAGRQAWVYIRA